MQTVPNFAQLQQRTLTDISAARRQVEGLAQRLDFGALIRSRMQHPGGPSDHRALEAWGELSESIRQRSGQAPMGTWVPLAALQRDLTASGSPYVVPTTGATGNSLLPESAILNAGATVLTGLQGSTFSLPRADGTIDAATSWVAENTAGPVSEPAFATSAATPKTLTVSMVLSRRLIHNSSTDINSLVRTEIRRKLSMAIDAAAINGDGTLQPLGLLGDANLEVVSAGTNGLLPTWAHVVELESRVTTRLAGGGQSPAFLMSPALKKRLRTTARGTNLDYIMPGADLLGHVAHASPSVPSNLVKGSSGAVCSALVFGDMQELVIGFWGPAAIDFLVDDMTLSARGAVRIVARAEVGVLVRQPDAFACFKDLLTA